MHRRHGDTEIPSVARQIAGLLNDYAEMIERAGGWRVDIPAAERKAWEARKFALLAEVQATGVAL